MYERVAGATLQGSAPDGTRVLVTLPATALPFGVAIQATALYPSLRAFIATVRRSR